MGGMYAETAQNGHFWAIFRSKVVEKCTNRVEPIFQTTPRTKRHHFENRLRALHPPTATFSMILRSKKNNRFFQSGIRLENFRFFQSGIRLEKIDLFGRFGRKMDSEKIFGKFDTQLETCFDFNQNGQKTKKWPLERSRSFGRRKSKIF